MNKFKAGDKVKRIGKPFGSVKVGDIETVETVRGSGSIELVDHFYVYDPKYFELVQDEKESTSAWLKLNKWFIRTGSPEKSKLVQEWLFNHDYEWFCGKTVQSDFKDQFLTNTNWVGDKEKYIMYTHNVSKDNAQEITLEFETVVKSVKLPEVPKPTEQELRIIELEATISKAQEQVKKIKEEM
jgi:hypothetical protein